MTNQKNKIDYLKKQLEKFPRINVISNPSPIEHWSNLEAKWGLKEKLFVKRDDLIGPAYGGNKSRQLEFILGDAIELGCDSIVHGGALQSNYCRQLTAIANKLKLETHLILSTHYAQKINQGNNLLIQILGAKIHLYEGSLGNYQELEKLKLFNKLKDEGKNPYLITYPKSEILGGLGYVKAGIELIKQLDSFPNIKTILMSAVGASYAGLRLALNYAGREDIKIIGVAPLHNEYEIEETILTSMQKITEMLELEDIKEYKNINIVFDEVGKGYGSPSESHIDILIETARAEGALLDPVYTSKALAYLRKIQKQNHDFLFWHTGGSPAIFAYDDVILERIRLS